ncbi:signal transduction histidine kinase [Agromyces cerinus]|uniref:sensor histidine kinase n=1 Tax=Agromyces cerinus TaxID=33878 RepID=UPI001EF84339|nr:sensor histidine kinase [Agromyces cerinus]MBM7832483.1 signal transduction histidine kinase [Agromyces cerinus]
MAILTVVAYATLPLGSASFEQQLLPTMLVGLAFTVLAIFGFRFVQDRSIWWAVAYVAVQLPLGFVVFSLSGAAIGSILLLVVLVSQSVLLLPLPAAAVVAAIIPFVHLGMDWQGGMREGLGTLAVTTFTLIVTWLLVRERAARAELADANERLRGYAAQAEQLAVIQERNRLARDIHDGVGHHLTVVQMQLEAARAVIRTAEPERLDAMLATAQDQSGQALAEVRRSVAALREHRPALPEALQTLAEEATEAGVPTEVEVLGQARTIRADVDESLFRAAQEGLTNVRKHADASSTTVVLDFSAEDHVRLEVRDDGRGLPEKPGDGFGLTGLRERMANLGGRISVEPAGTTGLSLTVEVPG